MQIDFGLVIPSIVPKNAILNPFFLSLFLRSSKLIKKNSHYCRF